MSRRTRRSEKRRRKRFERVLSLLEASNRDPKRRNRKTRLRQVWNYTLSTLIPLYGRGSIRVQAIARFYAGREGSVNADQA